MLGILIEGKKTLKDFFCVSSIWQNKIEFSHLYYLRYLGPGIINTTQIESSRHQAYFFKYYNQRLRLARLGAVQSVEITGEIGLLGIFANVGCLN